MNRPLSLLQRKQQSLPVRWYLLHLSTRLALLPVVGVLVLLLVPGTPAGYLSSDGYAIHFSQWYPRRDSGSWSHGWPWHYLERSEGSGNPAELRDPAWLNASAWWATEEAREWNYQALAADVAVAIFITFAFAAGIEWRRRRHSRFLQFSIVELGCTTGTIAALLSLWRSPIHEWRDEARSIAATHAVAHDFRGNYLGPFWLRQLVGAYHTRRWERVQYADLHSYNFHDASNRITAFKHLTCVSIDDCHGVDLLAELIHSLPRFEDLYISTGDARNEDLNVLLCTGKVKILKVRSAAVTDAGFANVRLCKSLKHIEVRYANISDRTLIQLAKLPQLQGVTLENVGTETQTVAISDAGIAELTTARHLFRAGFSGTRITDDGIRSLRACKELCQLYMSDTRVTGQGFDVWDADSHLDVLDLSGTAVTDDGLKAIARLRNLHDLRLSRTRVGDTGLAAVSALHNLGSLDLSGTHVTDAGLASLSGLAGLQWLDLGRTNVTDAGVLNLEKMHSLVALELSNSKVTNPAVVRLRAALPNCDVTFDPPNSDRTNNGD